MEAARAVASAIFPAFACLAPTLSVFGSCCNQSIGRRCSGQVLSPCLRQRNKKRRTDEYSFLRLDKNDGGASWLSPSPAEAGPLLDIESWMPNALQSHISARFECFRTFPASIIHSRQWRVVCSRAPVAAEHSEGIDAWQHS